MDDEQGISNEMSYRLWGLLYCPIDFKPNLRMSQGKPANVRCVQLSEDNLCSIFGSPLRPKICSSLKPSIEMCATNRDEAMIYLIQLEEATAPSDENGVHL